MKRFFFIAALATVTVFGIAATVTPSEEYRSYVTANISGLGKSIEFDTKTLVAIYNLLPADVQKMCVDSYADISSHLENSDRSFTYAGVKITPTQDEGDRDLCFTYGGHKVVVEDYTKAEFDKIFGL